MLAVRLNKKTDLLDRGSVLPPFVKSVAASVALAVALAASKGILEPLTGNDLFCLLLCTLAGGAVYLIVSVVLKAEELTILARLLRSFFLRKQ